MNLFLVNQHTVTDNIRHGGKCRSFIASYTMRKTVFYTSFIQNDSSKSFTFNLAVKFLCIELSNPFRQWLIAFGKLIACQ